MRFTKSKKKCVKKQKHIKNKKRLRSKKIRQTGGGALTSLMSMIPFAPKAQSSSIPTNSFNNQAFEQQNSQNVLVGALCNQFVKNNIKGNNSSTYDGVLDNLCSNQQVGLPARVNTVYSSNSMSQNNVANLSQQSFQPDNSNGAEQEGGDFQMPSFLSGVKGFAKMYSAPLRMGINAIKGFTTGKKSANQSQQTSFKKTKLSKKLRNKKRKRSKKKKKNKNKYQDEHREETLDEEIARAEREIEEEKKQNRTKIVENIKAGLENNIDLSSSKVLKK